jgi:hypothetical protein
MSIWFQAKLLLEHASGVSMDALHILIGVAAQLIFAALFDVPLKSWRPWLFVLALLLLNEASDLWMEQWPQAAMQYGEALKDIVLTMLLPSLLLLCARMRPAIFSGERPGPDADFVEDRN